ncbi:MAG: diaminopimelate epimerase [Saprospiraceae bacterium]|nr:diaminopimelate epimerase [Saprospiraceae bacterium]MBP7699028.1 diaminopimelate epimerase [Saprospiraceae bacterium]
MNIPFYKYHGTGNDFVVVDNREKIVNPDDQQLIAAICDRRFGVGSDGFMLLQNKTGYDFEMKYYNADGKESSMCGNGGRCIVAFAKKLNIIQNTYAKFYAIDGEHEANIEGEWVELKMRPVFQIIKGNNHFILDTGSPHYVTFVNRLASINVKADGKSIRNSEAFRKDGINVNFVEKNHDGLTVYTYERGVEDETLSCGTGVVASALAYLFDTGLKPPVINVTTKGGKLQVKQQRFEKGFDNIWLCGPTHLSFSGDYFCETLQL